MTTKKQELARARNYFKFRLLGAYTPIHQKFLTQKESIMLGQITEIKKALIGNFDKNSKELGLKIPEHRCHFSPCKNKAKHEFDYGGEKAWLCKKHFEYMKES